MKQIIAEGDPFPGPLKLQGRRLIESNGCYHWVSANLLKKKMNDNQQTTVIHFGQNKRLHI